MQDRDIVEAGGEDDVGGGVGLARVDDSRNFRPGRFCGGRVDISLTASCRWIFSRLETGPAR